MSKVFCFKRVWADQPTFAKKKNVTQIPRSKKKLQKALKTFLEPEFIDIFEKEITSYNDYPNKGI